MVKVRWYVQARCARLTLPETHSIFGGYRPTTHLRITVICGNGVSLFRIKFLGGEELAVSDVLESPKAVLAPREHPLRYRDEVSCGGKWR